MKKIPAGMVFALVVMGSFCGLSLTAEPADAYTMSFYDEPDHCLWWSYTWTDTATRDVTLTLHTDGGYPDLYFVNQANMNIYLSWSGTFFSIARIVNAGIGEWYTTFSFTPSISDTYYVVVDNTHIWGQNDYGYYASGWCSMTETIPSHKLYGYVFEMVNGYETSTPVSGATISLTGGYSATADQYGYYEVTVQDGTYTATVSATDHQTVTQTVTVSGANANEDFYLPLVTYSVSGHVYKTGTSTGIAGASVVFSGLTGGSATTDSSGYYTVYGCRSKTYSVTVTATGYQSTSGSVTVSGGSTTKDFYMTATAPSTYTVSGYVRNQESALAVAGATVSLSPVGHYATTDSNGHYSMSGVTDGSYTATVAASGFQTKTESITVAGGDVAKDFNLVPAAPNTYSLSGYVYKQGTTTGIAAATVALSPSGGSATTDSSGHYAIGGLPSGTYTATISATGYTTKTESVAISSADKTADFQLQASSSGSYTVSGYVYKSGTSTGVAGAKVTLAGGKSGTTDSSGHYSITGVAPGTYSVAVTATDYQTASGSVTVGSSDVTKDFYLTLKSTDGNGQDDKASTLSGPVLAGAIGAIIVAAGAVLILVLRRRKGGLQPSTQPQMPPAQGTMAPPPPPPDQGWPPPPQQGAAP